MKKTKTTFETWRYMGRTLQDRKVFYKWDDGTILHYFGKLPARAVGSLYIVEVERKDDSIVVHGRPKFEAGQSEVDQGSELRVKAQADDRTTAIELDVFRAEKAEAFREIEENLDALRSLYQRQKGGRRAAFLAHVIQRVTRR